VILVREEGYWFGHGVELHYAMGGGNTPSRCVKDTYEAMRAVVALMLEKGECPPHPSNQKREEQVNIRLTVLEKLQLETQAAQGGFNSISDYMRCKALEKTA